MGRTNKASKKKSSIKKVLVVQSQQNKQKRRTRTRPKTTRLGMIGKIAGGFWGPHGSDLGRAAGNMISKITGVGDYKINQNSITNGNSIPTFSSGTDGMKCCHREFLTDVKGSIDFTLNSYSINPGLSSVFPFLSKLAQNFEEYDFRGLVFEYRPTSGTALSSTSAALGVVIMATNYDASDPSFTTKQQMESYEFANATAPFTGCIHPVECARNRNVLESLYVRNTTQTSGTDIRLYDLGNFQIATAGMQSAYTVGELWVSYDCYLRKPRLSISSVLPAAYSFHATSGPGAFAGSSTYCMGTSPYIDNTPGFDNCSIAVNTAQCSILIKEVGVYYACVVGACGSSGTFTGGLVTSRGANLSSRTYLQGRTLSQIGFAAAGNNQVNYDECFAVTTAGIGPANYFSFSAIFPATVSWDVVITRIPTLTSVPTPLQIPLQTNDCTMGDRTPRYRSFDLNGSLMNGLASLRVSEIKRD